MLSLRTSATRRRDLAATSVKDDYLNISLRRPFSVDWKRAEAERERNMRRYNFNYNTMGVDKRTNLSIEEYRDVYDGKWFVKTRKLPVVEHV